MTEDENQGDTGTAIRTRGLTILARILAASFVHRYDQIRESSQQKDRQNDTSEKDINDSNFNGRS
jgi:hypothetical protein